MGLLKTSFAGEVLAENPISTVPVLSGLTDGVAVVGDILTVLVLGQPATGTIAWLLDGVEISGATQASFTVPATTGLLSARVDGQDSSAHAIITRLSLSLSWDGAVLNPGDTLTLLVDGQPDTAGAAELLRNGQPVPVSGGQFSVGVADLSAGMQARQITLPSQVSSLVTVVATPAPVATTLPGSSGSVTEGEIRAVDGGDIWQSDGATAPIAAREYRLVVDGVPGAGQGSPSLTIPAATAGQSAQPQLRARTATSAFSAWSDAGTPFTIEAATTTTSIYVDATTGSDTNTGALASPFQTLARAASEAAVIGDGVNIFLAAGGVWHESLDVSALNDVEVRAYGDVLANGLPFLNAADPISGFDDSTARGDSHTAVYSISHSHDGPAGQASGGPSVFEDGEMLLWVADIATCQATAGSFFHDGATSATTPVTLYVHPTGSTDPDSNGRSYEASRREWALRVGDDAIVHNIRAANQIHDNGAINFGHRGLIEGCVVHGSPIHDALGQSGEYRNCISWHPHSDTRTGAVALEFYTAAPYAGMAGQWNDCVVVGPPDDTLPRPSQVTGFGGHTATGSGAEYTWTVNDCALFGADVVAQDVSDLTLTRVSIRNGAATFAPTTQVTDLEIIADRSFQTGREIGIDGGAWTGGVANGLRMSVPADFNQAALMDCAGGTITRSILHINEGPSGTATGAARCVRLRQAGQAIGITSSILATPTGRGNNLVQADGAVTMANDDNVLWEFANGTRYSTPDGTNQTSLAPVQAAGLELNALETDPQIANPLDGDWTVAGAVGNRGLERPDIAYLGRPPSLAAAHKQVLGIPTADAVTITSDLPGEVTLQVDTNLHGGTIYAAARLVPDGLMTKTEILDGSGHAIQTGQNTQPDAQGLNTITITGLPEGSAIQVDVFHRPSAGAAYDSGVVSSDPITVAETVDLDPAEYSAITLSGPDGSGDLSLDIADLSKNASLYIIAELTAQGGVSNAQIAAGTNASDAPADIADSLALMASSDSGVIALPAGKIGTYHFYSTFQTPTGVLSVAESLGTAAIDTTGGSTAQINVTVAPASGASIAPPAPVANITGGPDTLSFALPADPTVSGGATITNRVAAIALEVDYLGNEQNPSAWGPGQNFKAFQSAGATLSYESLAAGTYRAMWEARDTTVDPQIRSTWSAGVQVVVGALTAPGQFGTGDWSIGPSGTPGDATISINALPESGGDPITDILAKIDGGSDVSLGGITPGDYTLSGFTDGVESDVVIFARNGIGDGADSASKPVTTGAPSAPVLTGASASASGSSAFNATVTTDVGNGTLYALAVAAGSAQPSAAAIKAGNSTPVTAAGVVAISGGGLQAETSYDIWLLHNGNSLDSAAVDAGEITTSAASSGGGLALMTFSDPPTETEIEQLMRERWHSRPEWLYDGSTPKVIGTDSLPAGCSYNAGENRVEVTGTVSALSGWDFAQTETTVRVESGGRIIEFFNNKLAVETMLGADRLSGDPEPLVRFPSGSTGRIDHMYRCWFTANETHLGGGPGPTALIQANPTGGNFPSIDLMEYCSFEGYAADGIKSCWSGVIRYCYFDCAYNVPMDAVDWVPGSYAQGDVVYSSSNSYYLRRANKATSQTPNFGSKLASTSDWDALDPHSDTNTPFFTPEDETLEIYGCFWNRDQTKRRLSSRQFNVGVVNALRCLPNNSSTQDIGVLDIQHNIFTDEVEARFNNQNPVELPTAAQSYGDNAKVLSNNRYQTRFNNDSGTHITKTNNVAGWTFPGAAVLSGVSASYGGGALTYNFNPTLGGWMRIVVTSTNSGMSAAELVNARAGDANVVAIFEIDAEAGTATSGDLSVVLSGTNYAQAVYQAGGGIDTLAPVQTVTS